MRSTVLGGQIPKRTHAQSFCAASEWLVCWAGRCGTALPAVGITWGGSSAGRDISSEDVAAVACAVPVGASGSISRTIPAVLRTGSAYREQGPPGTCLFPHLDRSAAPGALAEVGTRIPRIALSVSVDDTSMIGCIRCGAMRSLIPIIAWANGVWFGAALVEVDMPFR